jgi:hypothetical protein
MSLSSFRSPMVSTMFALVLAILCFAVAMAVADGIGEGDSPDPTGSGLWSHGNLPTRVSGVLHIVWLDCTCALAMVV